MVFQTSLGAGFRSLATSADQALKAGDRVPHSVRSPHGGHAHSGLGRHFLDEVPDHLLKDGGSNRAPLLHHSHSSLSRRRPHESSQREATLDRQNSSWSLPMSPAARFDDVPLALKVEEQADPVAQEPRSCCTPSGRAWLYPDLPWGAPPMWQSKRMPGRTFLKFWDVITFVGCMYVAIMVPYLAGFIDRPDWSLDDEDREASEYTLTCIFSRFGQDSFRTAVVLVDMLVDLIFWVDIVLSFHMAQWVICREGRLRHELIDDLPSIRSMYLKGNFAIDILGQIPWQYADCLGTGPELKLLRLFRMMKMLRLYRVDRMIQALYFKYPKSVFLVTMLQLLLYMFLCAHLMSCIWYFVSYGDPHGWIENDSWLATAELDANGQRTPDLGYAWISGLYWAIATMTTIGYGDISANTEIERAVAIICMVIGAAFFAWSCGKMTRALTEKSQCVTRFKDKWEEIEQFILANDIPQDITNKIMSFYMLKFPLRRIYDDEAIMNDLPLGLRKEVSVQLFEDVVKSVPLFMKLGQSTVQEICHVLKPVYQTMGLEITSQGERPDALYIVRNGIVSVMVMGEEVMEAVHGDLIGENEILNLTQSYRRNRTCIAKTSCELCRLSADHFSELLRSCKDLQRRCRLLVQAHLENLQDCMKMKISPSLRERYCVAWKQVAMQIDSVEIGMGDDDVDHYSENMYGSDVSIDQASWASWRKGAMKKATQLFQLGEVSISGQEHAQRVGGSRVLTTRFVLRLRSIMPTGDLFGCFSNIKYAVFGIQYGGTVDCKGSRERCFTDVFAVEQDTTGAVKLDKEIAINVRHLHNNWARLPLLRFVLYAVFYPDSFNPPLTGYLPNLDDPLPDDELQEVSVHERPATPPRSARTSANVSGYPGKTGWVKKASERLFQEERMQREKEGTCKRFTEADKAGIEALAAGHVNLKFLIRQRELISSKVSSSLSRGAPAATPIQSDFTTHTHLMTCQLTRRGTFPADVELVLNNRVERPLASDSPWRRVLKAIKILEPSRYFRNRSRENVRDLHRRFSAFMRDVACTKQDQQGRREDSVRELTMLVKGLHAHMSDMRETLKDVQERLINQEVKTRRWHTNECQLTTEDRQGVAQLDRSRPDAIDIENLDPADHLVKNSRTLDAEEQHPSEFQDESHHLRAVPCENVFVSTQLDCSRPSNMQPVTMSSAPQEVPTERDMSRVMLCTLPTREENDDVVREEKEGEEDTYSSTFASRAGRSRLASPMTSRSGIRNVSAAAMSLADTSSDSGVDTSKDDEDESALEDSSAPARTARTRYSASPAWQDRADEFLRGNIVRNFYS